MNTATMNGFFTIDTLQFSKRMQKAGLQKEVADELAEALRETQTQSSENVATKKEIESSNNSLEHKMDLLDHKFDSQIDLLRKDIKIAMYTTIGSIAAIIATVSVIKGFFH